MGKHSKSSKRTNGFKSHEVLLGHLIKKMRANTALKLKEAEAIASYLEQNKDFFSTPTNRPKHKGELPCTALVRYLKFPPETMADELLQKPSLKEVKAELLKLPQCQLLDFLVNRGADFFISNPKGESEFAKHSPFNLCLCFFANKYVPALFALCYLENPNYRIPELFMGSKQAIETRHYKDMPFWAIFLDIENYRIFPERQLLLFKLLRNSFDVKIKYDLSYRIYGRRGGEEYQKETTVWRELISYGAAKLLGFFVQHYRESLPIVIKDKNQINNLLIGLISAYGDFPKKRSTFKMLFRLVLQIWGEEKWSLLAESNTPIHEAAISKEYIFFLEALLEWCGRYNVDINSVAVPVDVCRQCGKVVQLSALYAAIFNQDSEAFDQLLKAGAHIYEALSDPTHNILIQLIQTPKKKMATQAIARVIKSYDGLSNFPDHQRQYRTAFQYAFCLAILKNKKEYFDRLFLEGNLLPDFLKGYTRDLPESRSLFVSPIGLAAIKGRDQMFLRLLEFEDHPARLIEPWSPEQANCQWGLFDRVCENLSDESIRTFIKKFDIEFLCERHCFYAEKERRDEFYSVVLLAGYKRDKILEEVLPQLIEHKKKVGEEKLEEIFIHLIEQSIVIKAPKIFRLIIMYALKLDKKRFEQHVDRCIGALFYWKASCDFLDILFDVYGDVTNLSNGVPLLLAAAKELRIDMVRYLIEHGADIHCVYRRTDNGRKLTIWLVALVQSDESLELLRLLMRHCFKEIYDEYFRLVNEESYPLIFAAIQLGNTELLNHFLTADEKVTWWYEHKGAKHNALTFAKSIDADPKIIEMLDVKMQAENVVAFSTLYKPESGPHALALPEEMSYFLGRAAIGSLRQPILNQIQNMIDFMSFLKRDGLRCGKEFLRWLLHSYVYAFFTAVHVYEERHGELHPVFRHIRNLFVHDLDTIPEEGVQQIAAIIIEQSFQKAFLSMKKNDIDSQIVKLEKWQELVPHIRLTAEQVIERFKTYIIYLNKFSKPILGSQWQSYQAKRIAVIKFLLAKIGTIHQHVFLYQELEELCEILKLKEFALLLKFMGRCQKQVRDLAAHERREDKHCDQLSMQRLEGDNVNVWDLEDLCSNPYAEKGRTHHMPPALEAQVLPDIEQLEAQFKALRLSYIKG